MSSVLAYGGDGGDDLGEDEALVLAPTENEMRFFELPYSNADINRAGRLLAEWWPYSEQQRDEAFDKVSAFRATHAYPLRVVKTVFSRYAMAIDPAASVYARSKRIVSIIAKLDRNANMKVTQMQDIGGCRAIMSDIGKVREIVSRFYDAFDDPEDYDYIARPKPDGYRSVHFVVRYSSSHPNYAHIPGRRIELQIRSKLQHLWATALETIDLFTGQTLKIGGGFPKWKRFFLLTAGLFAVQEECPPVDSVPLDRNELVKEATELWGYLRVPEQLNQWMTVITKVLPKEHGENAMYLVTTDVDKKTTEIQTYPSDQLHLAYRAYKQSENANPRESSKTAVLVSARSVDEIRIGYPSYYGDAKLFLDEIEKELGVAKN